MIKFREWSIEKKAGVLLVIVLVIAAVAGWFYTPKKNSPVNTFVAAQEIKKTENVTRKSVPVKALTVLDKAEVVKKIDLPPAVVRDQNEQVTSTATVAPTKGGSEVVSVTNTETGNTELLVRDKPEPLFGFPNQKRIGVSYGYSTYNVGPEIKVSAEWEFMRIGSVHTSVKAEAGNGGASASVRADYNF